MSEQPERAKVRCELHLEFDSEETANRVHSSVELDNQGYVATAVEGRTIHAQIEAESLNSLLHTLDDFLACTSVADKMVARKS